MTLNCPFGNLNSLLILLIFGVTYLTLSLFYISIDIIAYGKCQFIIYSHASLMFYVLSKYFPSYLNEIDFLYLYTVLWTCYIIVLVIYVIHQVKQLALIYPSFLPNVSVTLSTNISTNIQYYVNYILYNLTKSNYSTVRGFPNQ